ncbi:hypothetical protein HYV81_04320 [Candidatus Woesearchaeota archaeon]|nr:hypothetical protein [Candidatus Woesearchaeota archaeon]
MELEMQATFALTGINILLLLSLAYIYGRNWMKVKTSFSTGLLLFTAIFLIQSITSFYFYMTEMPYFVEMVSLHVLILTVLQTIAFSVLNVISWK